MLNADVPSVLLVCGAGPSSVAPPGPNAPVSVAGSSASPHGRSSKEERCVPSENTEQNLPARRSSPEREET